MMWGIQYSEKLNQFSDDTEMDYKKTTEFHDTKEYSANILKQFISFAKAFAFLVRFIKEYYGHNVL